MYFEISVSLMSVTVCRKVKVMGYKQEGVVTMHCRGEGHQVE